MTARKSYQCPNCGRTVFTQQAYVRHLLEEAGQRGVTTSEFLRWGAGSRFGARIHELRHDAGLFITEENELYTLLAGPVAVAANGAGHENPLVAVAADDTARASAGPVVGTGDMRPVVGRDGDPWRRIWMCRRCAYREVDGPVCPRGHLATKGWSADLRPRPVQHDLPIAA